MGEVQRAMSISMLVLLKGNQSRSDNVTKPRATPEGIVLKFLRHAFLLVVLLRVFVFQVSYMYITPVRSHAAESSCMGCPQLTL